MKLSGRNGTKWVDFNWIPALGQGADSRLAHAMAALETGLVDLWERNAWVPGHTGGAGLVFPVTRESLQRVHQQPGDVQVGYAVCEGRLAAAVILHLGRAIGDYALETMAWARRELKGDGVAFIRSACVSSDLRGLGIGRELLIQARRRARHLGADNIVGHLRVHPERDERLAQAYHDAGFTTTGDEQTVTIRQTIENDWKAMMGREEVAPIEWLPGSQVIELRYVPVAARTAKHRSNGSDAEAQCAAAG